VIDIFFSHIRELAFRFLDELFSMFSILSHPISSFWVTFLNKCNTWELLRTGFFTKSLGAFSWHADISFSLHSSVFVCCWTIKGDMNPFTGLFRYMNRLLNYWNHNSNLRSTVSTRPKGAKPYNWTIDGIDWNYQLKFLFAWFDFTIVICCNMSIFYEAQNSNFQKSIKCFVIKWREKILKILAFERQKIYRILN